MLIYFQNDNNGTFVNKHFTRSISDKWLSCSFFRFLYFIPFVLLFSSFFLTFFIFILLYLSRTCILFCRHIWAGLYFIFGMFLSGTFFLRLGGGGVHVYAQYYRELSFYDLVLTSMQLDFYN